jgi:RNA polymerase sigma-B factor
MTVHTAPPIRASSTTVVAHDPAVPSTLASARSFAAFDGSATNEQILRQRDGLPTDHPDRAALRTRAIEQNLPMALRLARRYAGRGEAPEDLAQVAAVALVKAVDGYDSHRGIPFVGYAIPSIVGALKRHFRDAGWTIRMSRTTQEHVLAVRRASGELGHRLGRVPTSAELADHVNIPLDDVLAAVAATFAYRPGSLDASMTDGLRADLVRALVTIDPNYAAVEDRMTLRTLVATLPKRDGRIVMMRFYDELTQTQIAGEMGISQMQVSRVLRRSLSIMRLAMSAETAPSIVAVRRSIAPVEAKANARR